MAQFGDDPLAEFTVQDLMVEEQVHRHANELAATLAGLRIVKSHGPQKSNLLDEAIDRVEAQCDIHRLMLTAGTRDLGLEVADLCHLLLRSRLGGSGLRIMCSVDRLDMAHDLRRVIVLLTYELINNAIKHSPEGSNLIRLILRGADDRHLLSVVNTVAATGPSSAGSRGIAIVAGLADRFGGSLKVRFTKRHARVSVSFERPLSAAAPF